MNSAMRWILAVIGWAVVLIVFAIWKDADAHMGNGALSGFLRGIFVFGGIYAIYRWARNGNDKKTE